jgi:hypothetical protein
MALLGARYHTLAADFIAKIETVPAVPDPDPERARYRGDSSEHAPDQSCQGLLPRMSDAPEISDPTATDP